MVTDESNNAIEDAIIKVNGVTASTKTDSKGSFTSADNYKAKTEVTIEASKSGYESNQPFKMSISADETLNRKTIELRSTSVKFSHLYSSENVHNGKYFSV